MFERFRLMAQRLDQHWIGDLLGVLSLFASGYGGLLLGYGAGLK